jgi:hypothetical protein
MKPKKHTKVFLYLSTALLGTSLVACSSASDSGEKESIVVQSTTTSTVPPTTTVAPATTTTTTTTQPTLPEGFWMPTLKPNVPCQEWTQIALEAGWPFELLSELFWEVWSESRCQNIIEGHPQWNGHDRGPLQINQVWLDDIEAKYGTWEVVNDPRYNFAWAWEMYKWYDYHRGCGFIPWSRPCK